MVWNKNLLADLGRPAKEGPGNIGPAPLGRPGSGDLAPAAGAHR